MAGEISVNFQRVPNQPVWQSQELMADSAENNTVILTIKADQGGTARLFWANHYDPQFNQPKSLWFFVKPGLHDYTFNLAAQNPNWIGWTKALVVYPEFDPNSLELVTAKIRQGDLLTDLASGWQEFWGPRGRLIIGLTINTIQSINLFGRSIYEYIYWLLFLTAVGWSGWLFYKQQYDWPEVGRAVFYVLIGCWLLLEASAIFTNWLWLKDDWKYVGKNVRDKYITANTGDFYQFIEFCQANIPAKARFDVRIPPIYNDIKAVYYLAPHRRTTLEADYLVVYNQVVEPAAASRYSTWKTYRPGALIMRVK